VTKGNSPAQKPEKQTSQSTNEWQDYIRKLRESDVQVVDTTQPGAATGFLGGLGNPGTKKFGTVGNVVSDGLQREN